MGGRKGQNRCKHREIRKFSKRHNRTLFGYSGNSKEGPSSAHGSRGVTGGSVDHAEGEEGSGWKSVRNSGSKSTEWKSSGFGVLVVRGAASGPARVVRPGAVRGGLEREARVHHPGKPLPDVFLQG